MTNLYQEKLSNGLAAHQSGLLDEAERIYQELILQDTHQPQLYQLLAMLYHDQGRLEEARELLETLLLAQPDDINVHHTLGNVLCDLRRYDDAEPHLLKAYQSNPDDTAVSVDLGILLQHQNKGLEAKALYESILQKSPEFAEVWNNLGNVNRHMGLQEEAIDAFEFALGYQPQFIEAYLNLSSLYQELNELAKALACCLQGLKHAPENLILLDALASLYYQTGEKEKALETYQKLINLDASHSKAQLSLGTIYFEMSDDHQAVHHFLKALESHPDYEEAYSGLGNAYHRLGWFDLAVEAFAKASESNPSKNLLKWRSLSTCPVIYESWQEIHDVRDRLTKLCEENQNAQFLFHPEELLYSGCEPSFFLTYQGLNDKHLKSLFGNVFYNLLEKQHQALLQRPTLSLAQDQIHLGFLVTEKHEGVFLKLNAGFINHLNPERFKLTIITHQTCLPIIQSRLQNQNVHYLVLEESLVQSAQKIKAAHLDVLLVYEVGSDAMNYFLPLFNLAPIQCTSFGLPITSGLPTMDYFISSKQAELPTAQDHYRESVFQLDWDPIYFYPQTHQMIDLKDRSHYGFRPTDHLMVCPQNLFKFHPDFDEALLRILIEDPKAHILTLASLWETWQARFRKRLENHPLAKQYPQALQRLHSLPRQSHHGYLNLLHIADVMLDTFHYTGGTTSYEGYMMGVPIVTRPYESTRSRQTLGNCHTMDLTDGVVNSLDHYVQTAIHLAEDASYNHHVRQEIQAKKSILFENPRAITEMSRFLEYAVSHPAPTRSCWENL
jgi:protein O-GlcNAc transferase